MHCTLYTSRATYVWCYRPGQTAFRPVYSHTAHRIDSHIQLKRSIISKIRLVTTCEAGFTSSSQSRSLLLFLPFGFLGSFLLQTPLIFRFWIVNLDPPTSLSKAVLYMIKDGIKNTITKTTAEKPPEMQTYRQGWDKHTPYNPGTHGIPAVSCDRTLCIWTGVNLSA